MTEEELWREYKKTKDAKLREKLIMQYASLVKYVAGRVAINTPPQVEFDDLVGYGILGLIDAIEKFNLNQGFTFKTYATARIRGRIIDELRIIDWLPRSVRKKTKQLADAYESLEYKLNRPATDEEVAEFLGIRMDTFYQMLATVKGISLISLNDLSAIEEDNEEVFHNTVLPMSYKTPATIVEKEETKRLLIEAIYRLPENERMVISLYYYEDLTLREIGEVIGVTESRISQLHTKALLRLRRYLKWLYL